MDSENTLLKSPKRKRTPETRAKEKLDRFERKCVAIAYYGLVCKCCGEWRIDCLTLDHINNDGGKHRAKEIIARTIYNCVKAKGYPAGYQVLCYNCNNAKRVHPSGMCPHELERKAAMNGYVESSLEATSTT